MSCLGKRRSLMIPGLLLLGALACGTNRESRHAGLVERRETEFADLSQQAGMDTPSYLQARKEARPVEGYNLQAASADLQPAGDDAPPR